MYNLNRFFLVLVTTASASAQSFTDDLTAYWSFNQTLEDVASQGGLSPSSAIADDGQFVNQGSADFQSPGLTGDSPFGDGYIQYDGEDGYVTVPHSTEIDFTDSDLTISIWCRVDLLDTTWQSLIVKGEFSDYRIARQSNNDSISYAGGSFDIAGGSVDDGLDVNNWHHIVATTTEGGNIELFVDGLSVAVSEDGTTASIVGRNGALAIGANLENAGREWEGGIDDVALWGRVLSTAEIESLYNQGTSGLSLRDILYAEALAGTGDTDSDGMPDAWETLNGLTVGTNDAMDNADADNLNNLAEYLAETDPNVSDTDNDGLLDHEENGSGIYVSPTNTGSHPLNGDSDGDGIGDREEVDVTVGFAIITNPNKADSDDDTFDDLLELTLGSDPNNDASQPTGDSLPIFDNFSSSILNASFWTLNDALDTGFIFNDVLELPFGASIHTTTEFDPASGGLQINGEWRFVTDGDPGPADTLKVLTRADSVIDSAEGGTKEHVSGIEFRLDLGSSQAEIITRGSNLTVTDLKQFGEINFTGDTDYIFEVIDNGADYVSMRVTEVGNPDNFTFARATVTADTSATNFVVFNSSFTAFGGITVLDDLSIKPLTDTDGDGAPDFWEEANGLDKDTNDAGTLNSDTDTLTNLAEFQNGTDPNLADTDGDQSDDGDEISNGTDPFDQDSDDDGLLDNVETNTGTFVDADDTGSDPNDADTDNDGMNDFREVTAGRNPVSDADKAEGLAAGLVAYWSFDTNLNDVAHTLQADSAVADDGVFTDQNEDSSNVSISNDGLFGSALLQDGTDGIVSVAPSEDTLRASDNSVTISVWARVPAFTTGWQTLVSHGQGSQYRLARQDEESTLSWAGGTTDIRSTKTVDDGNWHHIVAISEDGVGTRLFIDGMSEVEATNAPMISDIGLFDGVNNLVIGGSEEVLETDNPPRAWNGNIDDLAIWNRALTEEEIATIYNSGTGASINSLTGGVGPTIPRIQITNFERVIEGGETKVRLTWKSTPGTNYLIRFNTTLSEDMPPSTWTDDGDDGILSEGTETSSTTNLTVDNEDTYFFIVEEL